MPGYVYGIKPRIRATYQTCCLWWVVMLTTSTHLKQTAFYFPISINLFATLSHINTEYMVLLLSGAVDHAATAQLPVLISVGSRWCFLPATRAEGGTGRVLLPVLAHPTCCTHWPQPASSCRQRECWGSRVYIITRTDSRAAPLHRSSSLMDNMQWNDREDEVAHMLWRNDSKAS